MVIEPPHGLALTHERLDQARAEKTAAAGDQNPRVHPSTAFPFSPSARIAHRRHARHTWMGPVQTGGNRIGLAGGPSAMGTNYCPGEGLIISVVSYRSGALAAACALVTPASAQFLAREGGS